MAKRLKGYCCDCGAIVDWGDMGNFIDSDARCIQCIKHLEYVNGEASPEDYEPGEDDWPIQPWEM